MGSFTASDIHPTAPTSRLTALRATTRHGLPPAASGALPSSGSAAATHEPRNHSIGKWLGAVELGGERLLFTRHWTIVGELWTITEPKTAAEATVK